MKAHVLSGVQIKYSKNKDIFAAKLFELVQFTEYTFQLMNVELAFKIQTVKSVL